MGRCKLGDIPKQVRMDDRWGSAARGKKDIMSGGGTEVGIHRDAQGRRWRGFLG